MHSFMRKLIICVLFLALALLAAVLLLPARMRHTPPESACRSNRRIIELAKEMYAEEQGFVVNGIIVSNALPMASELTTDHIKGGFSALKCPSGGSYSINRLAERPSCSIHGTE